MPYVLTRMDEGNNYNELVLLRDHADARGEARGIHFAKCHLPFVMTAKTAGYMSGLEKLISDLRIPSTAYLRT